VPTKNSVTLGAKALFPKTLKLRLHEHQAASYYSELPPVFYLGCVANYDWGLLVSDQALVGRAIRGYFLDDGHRLHFYALAHGHRGRQMGERGEALRRAAPAGRGSALHHSLRHRPDRVLLGNPAEHDLLHAHAVAGHCGILFGPKNAGIGRGKGLPPHPGLGHHWLHRSHVDGYVSRV
jgi:hypothetical protein